MHKISQKLYHKFKNQRMVERDEEKPADLTLDRIWAVVELENVFFKFYLSISNTKHLSDVEKMIY